MKKTIFALLLIAFLFSSTILYADDGNSVPDPAVDMQVSDEMLEILDLNLDNLFPITVKREYFNEPHEMIYSEDDPSTIIGIRNARGSRDIRIFANADSIHDHMAYETIDEDFQTDFQITLDLVIKDTWPVGEGGCFIGFTNYGVSAFTAEDGEATIGLVSDAKNIEFYVKSRSAASGKHYPLQGRGRDTMKISLIHLTGHTYVYVEGSYFGQLHDGLDGPFQLLYGAVLFENGDSASCSFDNMIIRKLGSHEN